MGDETEREAEGLPGGIEKVAKELVQKALFEVLGEEEESKGAGAKVPPFEDGFPKAAAHLKDLVAESFGETRQDGPELEYVSAGAFVYDYGRTLVFNRLQRAAFEATPVAERAIFLPHCLRNRKRCEAEENELYDTCARCGACAIANIVQIAEDAGYRPDRLFVVGGASVITPIIQQFEPGAVAGVACMEELGMVVEHMLEGTFTTPAQMALLRRHGCKNTRVVLSDVRAIL